MQAGFLLRRRIPFYMKKSLLFCSLNCKIRYLYGELAQLGERMAGSHEVRGSSPLFSTKPLKFQCFSLEMLRFREIEEGFAKNLFLFLSDFERQLGHFLDISSRQIAQKPIHDFSYQLENRSTEIRQDDITYGICMAEEVLRMMPADMIETGEEVFKPSNINEIACADGFVTMMAVDVAEDFKGRSPVKKH